MIPKRGNNIRNESKHSYIFKTSKAQTSGCQGGEGRGSEGLELWD